MLDPGKISLLVNGRRMLVAEGSSVCAAMLNVGAAQRISVGGNSRAALCGMGICFECRAIVDGSMHRRTCQLICREGMAVETQP